MVAAVRLATPKFGMSWAAMAKLNASTADAYLSGNADLKPSFPTFGRLFLKNQGQDQRKWDPLLRIRGGQAHYSLVT